MQIKTIAMLLAIALPAGATTLFSSFGAGDTFEDGGLGIGGATSQIGYNAIAFAFTPGVDFMVTQIDLVISLISGSGFIVDLDTNSGNVPSVVLGSWALPSPPFPAAVSTLTSPGVALTAGNTYWLAVLPAATDSWGFWDANPDGERGERLRPLRAAHWLLGKRTERQRGVEPAGDAGEAADTA